RFCAASLRKESRRSSPRTASPSRTARTAMSQRRGFLSVCDMAMQRSELTSKLKSSKFKVKNKLQLQNSNSEGVPRLGAFSLELHPRLGSIPGAASIRRRSQFDVLGPHFEALVLILPDN